MAHSSLGREGPSGAGAGFGVSIGVAAAMGRVAGMAGSFSAFAAPSPRGAGGARMTLADPSEIPVDPEPGMADASTRGRPSLPGVTTIL
jgi:hypothetical protein